MVLINTTYRVMKKTFLSIAVIAATVFVASCQEDIFLAYSSLDRNSPQFTAAIETVASTKTIVERVTDPSVAYKTYWESTDQININGAIYTAAPDGTDATKATFTKSSGDDPTATFNAYFPAVLFDGTTATLPASYTYADGKYNMPMYAQSETESLSFKNLCGVLAITVSGTVLTSVNSIEVSSNQQMNGAFTATNEGVLSFASKTLVDADKKVALNFTSAKAIASDGSATFYVPVPAGTHNPLTIKISDGTATKTMITKKSGGVEVARNAVYPIAFADNSAPAYVTIGGKKWAIMNLGATTVAGSLATCAGDFYQWGSVNTLYESISWSGTTCTFQGWKSGKGNGFVADYLEYSGTADLPDANDVVKQKIGNGWRMPTSDDFTALYKACGGTYPVFMMCSPTVLNTATPGKGIYWLASDQTYISEYSGVIGILFVDESGNKLFFPLTGQAQDTFPNYATSTGKYWTSSYKETYSQRAAIVLSFGSSSTQINAYTSDQNLYLGYSIRPISD